jgi:hypothetical protein
MSLDLALGVFAPVCALTVFLGSSLYLWRATSVRGAAWLVASSILLVAYFAALALAPAHLSRLLAASVTATTVFDQFIWLALLLAAAGFGRMALHLARIAPRPRPNNSSKPTPLRGAA